MKSVTLTTTQASFLSKLRNFTLDERSISKNCDVKHQRIVHGMNFCIAGDVASNSDSDPDDDGGPPIFEHVLLGIVCGGLLLAVLAGGFVAWDKRRKTSSQSTRTSNMEAAMTDIAMDSLVASGSARTENVSTESSKSETTKFCMTKPKKPPVYDDYALEEALMPA